MSGSNVLRGWAASMWIVAMACSDDTTRRALLCNAVRVSEENRKHEPAEMGTCTIKAAGPASVAPAPHQLSSLNGSVQKGLCSCFENSVCAIGHETSCPGRQAIDRSGGGYVKRPVIVVAPRKVGRLFRHLDRPQMLTLRIPDPDASRTGHKQISFVVNLDTVRNTFVLSARLFAENPAVANTAIAPEVVHPNISLLAVIHIQTFSVR